MRLLWHTVLVLLVSVALQEAAHSANSVMKKNDVRVLIDVSGSMKQNDPHKLRAPALRLLVGLLPDGSKSGVWTFAQYVNMQVKYGRVDKHWKKMARTESEKIHSRGLYTNIEEALIRASFGWIKPDPEIRRNLILLTDGMVDISRDAKKNAASREHILKNIIPRLKKAGAKIHAIALSEGADKALLKQISAQTGGRYIEVDSAGSLERAFLKLFEQTAPADSLPIKDNRFKVDTSVQDMTVLVFRKDAGPVVLMSPQGDAFDYQQHPNNFSWHQEQSYELVTIKKPAAGEWRLKGSVDPDNRVMIVTNLKLNTNELTPSILAGDELQIEAELLDEGKRIRRQSFLNLVEFDVVVNGEHHYPMQDTGKGADNKRRDGRYSADLSGRLAGGEQSLIIRAKGPTFEREFRYAVDNFLSIIDIKLSEDEAAEHFYLSIIPHMEILDPESLQVQLELEGEGPLAIQAEPGGVWVSEISKSKEGEFLIIRVHGKRHTGAALETEIKKKLVLNTVKSGHQDTQASSEYEREDNETEHAEAESHTDEATEEEGEEETNWILIGWVTMVINLIIGIIGVLGFQFWKKKKAAQDEEDDKDVAL